MIKSSFLNQEFAQIKKDFISFQWPKSPEKLYEPIEYILGIGGKRIRPVLVYASSALFGEHNQTTTNFGLAVEIFHNFTLMHDDIMDDAALRRGHKTVHEKYNVNTAILSGDMALIKAYQLLQTEDEATTSEALSIFNQMAEEVCKGQQLDIDFEASTTVSISDYIQMIEWKTSVLLGASMQLGALANKTSGRNQYHLYEFGKNIGIAFQIQDDMLDTFGNQARVGKRIGGDILQNKKTYLYLKALELLPENLAKELSSWFEGNSEDEDLKIKEVTKLYEEAMVKVYAVELMNEYKSLALSHLEAVKADNDAKKEDLKEFADFLIRREY